MTTASTAVSTWIIDGVHSIAEFSVKHMVISTVKGRFRTIAGSITVDEANPANSRVEASIDVASIDTAEPQRDAHLRSDDFFNAEQFPQMTFRSTRVERVDDTHWKVHGDLTLKGVTRPVVLDTTYLGQETHPFSQKRVAAFTAETTLDRKDFGLNWQAPLASGAAYVGEEVRINLEIEAVRQD